MVKRKAVTSMVAIFMVLLLAVGCSNSSGDDTGSTEGTATVDFMHLWPQGSSAEHYRIVNEIIADFEEENEININLQVLSNEQYKDQITILSASNELPDVGMTWAAGYLDPFVEGNKFTPLDDLLGDGLRDEFVAGTLEAYEKDGQTYGLPLELNTVYVYYNQAIFDEHNLTAPETYEELEQVVNTLNENNVNPIALGNRDRWTGSMWYMYFADRIGGSDTLTSAIDRSGSFEDPALVEAAAKVQELVENDSFISGFNGLADEEAKSMFMNEQAAMYMIATWDLPNFTTNEDVPQEFRDSVGYFKFPTVDGVGDTNSFVGGPGVGLFVSEDSDVQEEAKQFAKYFVEQWGERAVSEAGVLPATIVDGDSLDLPDMYVEVLNDLNEATNLTLYADVQMSAAAAQTHLDLIQSLFGLQITPEEFAELHERALSEE
ncbi:ABC transporter substrate-binding protein [Alkalihalobacillus alcalophilus ATCC 27647 = CGMCC 1.3604]|uniref:ABC transporter substrate-binding protein n=1 Tax=Alkalihalobacillus alcalophilus ATCC 27647 = CGMCC 1.3604 TaxID=1218173 RepID=A0A094WIA9_ALKAL|nr:extracellular solute-binding protein [Alkalihalobacillus alcalophilus]KGA97524.1 ABC transporter substrate-binding protein [Alkalihalobacillus alcalophilus ATCC 27647 = CGMCC 1.3604]MED1560777.1 extracellular solute-binding protein [Alkalihalobacillus alcalophilus]THG92435.1 ABC transporter substrate-binding protein [Alkalihalobacillus alcalophilus ATCC 27647 = CGMCC 1.3604]